MLLKTLEVVDAIHKEKGIDKELIFQSIEGALKLAAQKIHKEVTEVSINRETGQSFVTTKDGKRLTPEELGRVGAQIGKHIIMQKIREATNDAIYKKYCKKKYSIISGYIKHQEKDFVILDLDEIEGKLPANEQVKSEQYQIGEYIRAYLLDVKKINSKVKAIVSRKHPIFVKKLLELEIPEIAYNTIKIKSIVREAGYRTKIAVFSLDEKVDCIGACIGIKGSRIQNITNELRGEKIDIIRWNSSPKLMIKNALSPAKVSYIILDEKNRKAQVFVNPSQQPLAIGKDGQNVRLASKLCRYEIDIMAENGEIHS
mgnify:FL=1